jgi:hypothetical protein
VSNAGHVGPGNSPGLLTVVGNYTQTSAGVLDIDLGGLLRGTEYDALDAAGFVLGGTLTVSLVDLGSGVFNPDTFACGTGWTRGLGGAPPATGVPLIGTSLGATKTSCLRADCSATGLGQRRICGVEALLRWHNPEFGAVSPYDFVPLQS